MAVILYDNAVLLVNGSEFTIAVHELGVDYMVESLDQTAMGDNTRSKVGGLYTGKISGKAWFDSAVGADGVIWGAIGVDQTVFAIFPDGITEGSLTTGMGYICRGVMETFSMGGAVGVLLDVAFAAESQGYLS